LFLILKTGFHQKEPLGRCESEPNLESAIDELQEHHNPIWKQSFSDNQLIFSFTFQVPNGNMEWMISLQLSKVCGFGAFDHDSETIRTLGCSEKCEIPVYVLLSRVFEMSSVDRAFKKFEN
jgi:hypothetical protein